LRRASLIKAQSQFQSEPTVDGERQGPDVNIAGKETNITLSERVGSPANMAKSTNEASG